LRGTVRPLPGIVIARNGLVEQVGDAIRELIIDQALAPGERLLEGYAARVGAPRVSRSELDRMRQALAGMQEVQAGPTFSESKEHVAHDHAFHTVIMQSPGNSVLLEIYQSLNLHMHLSRLYHGRGVAELERTRNEHRMILDAYELRDGAAAEAAVLAHIEAARVRQLARLQHLTNA
jgi:DNA-binding GntR family transcriptional regulator